MQKNTTRSLKIGFVVDDGLDKPDGVQQYVLALGAWLDNNGHRVHYLAGQTKRGDIKNLVSLSNNLKVRFNGNVLSTPLPAAKKKIRQLLAREKFDVLHVQMPYSPFLAGKVIKDAPKSARIVGTFHILPVGKFHSLANRLLGVALRPSLRKFDKVVSVSQPAKEFAHDIYGIDSIVIANPVDLKRFKRPKKTAKDTIDIVFLGRLVRRKGCMELLREIDILLKKRNHQNIRLHICGDGPERKKIEEFVNGSRLKGITTMHGFVSEVDKINYLNQADFAIFPALYGESFGIVLTEAMAAGAGVVLGGNNPGYASVLSGFDQCLFDPRKDGELASKVQDFIANPTLFTETHQKQQQRVKDFDIEKVGAKLLKIYTDSA